MPGAIFTGFLHDEKLARAYASADAHVIYGTAYDEGLGDQRSLLVLCVALLRRRHNGSIDDLPAHRSYSDVIDEQLLTAKAVVVIWSPDDVFSAGANLEALMPVFMKSGGKGILPASWLPIR